MRQNLSQSLTLKTEKREKSKIRHGTIVGILWQSHSFVVNTRGPGANVHAKADSSLPFGTKDHPLVFVHDEVDIEQRHNHKWYVTKYYHRIKCVISPSDTDESQAYTSDTQTFSPTILPETTFNPPYASAGQIYLPDYSFTPVALTTYDVGGGYDGTIPAGTIAQRIGLVNAAAWTRYFVSMTGSDSWTITLNGSTIASGSGSGYGSISVSFTAQSSVVFTLTATGASSNLDWGVGA